MSFPLHVKFSINLILLSFIVQPHNSLFKVWYICSSLFLRIHRFILHFSIVTIFIYAYLSNIVHFSPVLHSRPIKVKPRREQFIVKQKEKQSNVFKIILGALDCKLQAYSKYSNFLCTTCREWNGHYPVLRYLILIAGKEQTKKFSECRNSRLSACSPDTWYKYKD